MKIKVKIVYNDRGELLDRLFYLENKEYNSYCNEIEDFQKQISTFKTIEMEIKIVYGLSYCEFVGKYTVIEDSKRLLKLSRLGGVGDCKMSDYIYDNKIQEKIKKWEYKKY